MNPWSVDAGCPRTCALRADSRVGAVGAARRYAALGHELGRSLALGERLADGDAVRVRARRVLGALGVRLDAGPVPLTVPGGGAGTLVVTNHISWLDVVALLAVEPVAFVAKREVGRWPVVGALARRLGTQFIDREGGRRELPLMVEELAKTLAQGRSVLVFPQATTWCSISGGRFRRAAFQAAVDAGAAVRPVTVAYEAGGAGSTTAAFLGDEGFGTSLRRVVRARGLSVRVLAHAPLYGSDRKGLAEEAWTAVTGCPPLPGLPRGPAH
ncbi:lysophospholipid acyltransferase family protein [Streptomyces sp. AN091965]|uniref:lysophospholipid acyltransferase family protein n=1 Tax=Streptomyces sp. AN091965 TaxID=2927803 RepID=UPI001F60965C|nr:lysophospholipid acyltransferase family protein [Streptomyces sp. AN091965]MCI3929153.1 1-acyl-sn-glycerol-3-phosphate acyltransferase [Streptomyces sp. AN091965]